MKRFLLIAGSALIAQAAFAAGSSDTKPAAQATASASAAASANAAADAKADTVAKADAVAKQKELAELRVQMRELTRKMAALSTDLGERGPRSYAMRYLGNPDGAMVGIVPGMSNNRVVVGALTPDGPAYRAGLRGDDVITSIDNHPIGGNDVVAASDQATALLANLKDGQNVSIEYVRDGKPGVVVFPAERRAAYNWSMMFDGDPEHPLLPKDFDERMRKEVERATREAERVSEHDRERIDRDVERATREAERVGSRDRARTIADAQHAVRDAMKHVDVHANMRIAMPWWGLNLAPLNADLGRYFGTDKGVLVIAADKDSLPGIRAGDVITNIAGERIARPEDALRALRDQDAGKDVPITLMREHTSIALSMKTPAFNSIFNMSMPPMPPVPPAPPSPKTPAVPAAPPAVSAPAIPAPPPAPPTPDDA